MMRLGDFFSMVACVINVVDVYWYGGFYFMASLQRNKGALIIRDYGVKFEEHHMHKNRAFYGLGLLFVLKLYWHKILWVRPKWP